MPCEASNFPRICQNSRVSGGFSEKNGFSKALAAQLDFDDWRLF